MVMLMGLIMLVTYGTNFFLIRYLKQRPHIDVIEKLSMLLGINMSVLFLDGILLFVGKLLIDTVEIIE
ncbi:hypothetical protein [Enterococcus sp.]|uniref:hypothetical protein n=1 Tax=Enterococcus sp. TaxID=35783 RepID=UPI000EE56B43|nr:hypothetical protein [Enterococcus sp.]HCE13315.1 hypothetical protein [Enterococcus sp.]